MRNNQYCDNIINKYINPQQSRSVEARTSYKIHILTSIGGRSMNLSTSGVGDEKIPN